MINCTKFASIYMNTKSIANWQINNKLIVFAKQSDDSCPPTGQCPSSGDTSDNGSDSPESMTNVINNNSSATTYAQLENALPLNYLTEANLISNKLASRQLISHLNNNNNNGIYCTQYLISNFVFCKTLSRSF